jgi:hypothetical protein
MTALSPHRVELPTPAEAAARARWLESMSPAERDAVHERPMRLVEQDFLHWLVKQEPGAGTVH